MVGISVYVVWEIFFLWHIFQSLCLSTLCRVNYCALLILRSLDFRHDKTYKITNKINYLHINQATQIIRVSWEWLLKPQAVIGSKILLKLSRITNFSGNKRKLHTRWLGLENIHCILLYSVFFPRNMLTQNNVW